MGMLMIPYVSFKSIMIDVHTAESIGKVAPFLGIADVARVALSSKQLYYRCSRPGLIIRAARQQTQLFSKTIGINLQGNPWLDAFKAACHLSTAVHASQHRMDMSAKTMLAILRENREVCGLVRALHEWSHAGYAILAGKPVESGQQSLADELMSTCLLESTALAMCAASELAASRWNAAMKIQPVQPCLRPMGRILRHLIALGESTLPVRSPGMQFEYTLAVKRLFGQLEYRWVKALDIEWNTFSDEFVVAAVPGLRTKYQQTTGVVLASFESAPNSARNSATTSVSSAQGGISIAQSNPYPVGGPTGLFGSQQSHVTRTAARSGAEVGLSLQSASLDVNAPSVPRSRQLDTMKVLNPLKSVVKPEHCQKGSQGSRSTTIMTMGSGLHAARWLRTAMDSRLSTFFTSEFNQARLSMKEERQTSSSLRDNIPSCYRWTRCGRWCYSTCPTNAMQAFVIDCLHMFVSAVCILSGMISLCWDMVPHGCVYLAIRHEAGVSGFENVSAYVASNTTQAMDTLVDTLEWCGSQLTDFGGQQDNLSVIAAYDEAMQPLSDQQLALVMVGPALIAIMLIGTVVLDSFLCCLGSRRNCTARTVAMLWCPCKAYTGRLATLGEVANEWVPEIKDPVWMTLPTQFDASGTIHLHEHDQNELADMSKISVVVYVAALLFGLCVWPWLVPAWNHLTRSTIAISDVSLVRENVTNVNAILATDLDGLWLAGYCAAAAGLSVLAGVACAMAFQVLQVLAADGTCWRCCSSNCSETRYDIIRGLIMQNIHATILGVLGFFFLVAGGQVVQCSTRRDCDLLALTDRVRWTLQAGNFLVFLICFTRLVIHFCVVEVVSRTCACCCWREVPCLNCVSHRYRPGGYTWGFIMKPLLSMPSSISCLVMAITIGISIVLSFALDPSNPLGSVMIYIKIAVVMVGCLATIAGVIVPFWLTIAVAACNCKHDGSRYSDSVTRQDNSCRAVVIQAGFGSTQSRGLALVAMNGMCHKVDMCMLDSRLQTDIYYACTRLRRRGLLLSQPRAGYVAALEPQLRAVEWTPFHIAQACHVLQKTAKQHTAVPASKSIHVGANIRMHEPTDQDNVQARDSLRRLYFASVRALKQASRATRLHFKSLERRSDRKGQIRSYILRTFVCIEVLAIKLRSELGPLADTVLHQRGDVGAERHSSMFSEETDNMASSVLNDTASCSRAARFGIQLDSRVKPELLQQVEAVLDILVGAFEALNAEKLQGFLLFYERGFERRRLLQEIEQRHYYRSSDASGCSQNGTSGCATACPRNMNSTKDGTPCSGLDAMQALRMARYAWSGPASWPRASTNALVMATGRENG